ncbi:MAG: alanine--glyoxylate aminotransferase family protein, partial [Zetaproteobacteria bacterium]
VLLKMAAPMIHHRTPQFSQIFAETREMLRQVFQTEQDPIMLASSGTGAMEAALVNLCSPGDTVIYVNGGKFGERWGKIAAKHGLRAAEIKVPWGEAVTPEAVAEALERHPEAKAVCVQASETSTTTEHPVREIAEIVRARPNTALVVDAITALGVVDLPMDEWGLDAVVSGSQKAFMLPPGLAMIACSEKYWRLAEGARCGRFYFDLAAERKAQAQGSDTTAWTPAVSLIIGLHEVLTMMLNEGLANVFARHALLAEAARAGVEALGLRLISKRPATSATGAFIPEGIPGGAFVKYLRDQMGVTFAGGQDQFKGKIVRIAHLGYYDAFDIVIAISALEMALKRFGVEVPLGKGVAAAEAVLTERFPKPVA